MGERPTPNVGQPTNGSRPGGLPGGCGPARPTPGASSSSWVGVVAVLIGLVATVGGSLKDEFEVPGRTRSGRPT